MAYDQALAARIRSIVNDQEGLTEKAMFGGLAFLLNGNMAVAASGQGGLLVRVDPAQTETLIAKPHADRMRMGGREMDGWLRVAPEGVESERELKAWVRRGVEYASALPAKKAPRKR